LPQLDTSTFASQIFWILVGFSLVYLFVSRVFAPKIEKILSDRELHTESMLGAARGLKSDADRLEENAAAAFESARKTSIAAESDLMSAFKEQSAKEKKTLDDLFSVKSQKESDLLIESSEKAFSSVLEKMDEIVDAAAVVVFNSARKKS
jgi:F-type H+-transporting ATPase subunit b